MVNSFVLKMSQNNVEFENLKKKILTKCEYLQLTNVDIQNVKEYFSCIVDSRRTLSKIQNLNDMFHVLEERDALDHNHVYALTCLGQLLKNEDIINLVSGYKKHFVEEEETVCTCGEDSTFSFPVINPQREYNQNKLDSLEIAIHNVAMNIGKDWRILASELVIPECYIDEIRKKYPSDFCQQALKVLQIWKKYNGEDATLEALKKALEARLCKMKGIGIHMLKPVITVD